MNERHKIKIINILKNQKKIELYVDHKQATLGVMHIGTLDEI